MITVEDFKAASNGRWPGIMSNLGIDVGTGKHKPCPICGGTDRFRFDDKDGTGSYFCNQCGAGSGVNLVMGALALSFPDAMKKVSEIVGAVEVGQGKPKPNYDVKKMLNDLWADSKPLCGSDTVSKYLHNRGLVIEPMNVRYCEGCYESDTKEKYNAMVALVSCSDGTNGAIHRTYLQDGKKADLKAPKKLTPNVNPLSGGAVRLFPLEYKICTGDTVGVAEGIETAIAATQLFEVPTWAAIGTSMMEAFVPTKGIKRVVIFGDNDSNFAGQKAAYILGNRLISQGYVVDVEIPDDIGDWADQLLEWKSRQN